MSKQITEPSDKFIYIGDDYYLIDPSNFQIDDSNLDAELCNIAQLLMAYGHIEAKAKLITGQAEADLDFCGAIVYNEVKTKADEAGEKRTVDQLKNAVLIDQRYVDSVAYLNFTREQHARARWAVLALQHKSEALRVLSYRDNRMNKLQYEG